MKARFEECNALITKVARYIRGGADEDVTSDIPGLIEKTRADLTPPNQRIGAWEDLELMKAHRALNGGFLELALIAVETAIAVKQLSPEEYKFGYNVAQRQESDVSEINTTRASSKISREETAKDLKISETLIANHLDKLQLNIASKLLDIQMHDASKLDKQNKEDARDLLLVQEKAMETLKMGEARIVEHMRDLEATLAWMAGGYVITTDSPASVFNDMYLSIQKSQEEIALMLKNHQIKIAVELKSHQAKIADAQLLSEKDVAEELKQEEKKTAAILKEKQEVKALKKKYTD